MDNPLGSPFSEADVEVLAARLGEINNPDSLSLEGVDGLFCALVANPDLVSPSEYLPVILGGDLGHSQSFADLDDANSTMSLLLRYWNSVAADFERKSMHFPYVEEPGVEGILGRAWARGYLKGTRLASAGWDELWNSDTEGQLLSIPLVAGEVDSEWPTESLTPEKREELLQWMIAGAARAYRHFQDARGTFVDGITDEDFGDDYQDDDYYPETYVRTEPKIGRNDPCPCGSGKKYKKCCG